MYLRYARFGKGTAHRLPSVVNFKVSPSMLNDAFSYFCNMYHISKQTYSFLLYLGEKNHLTDFNQSDLPECSLQLMDGVTREVNAAIKVTTQWTHELHFAYST